MAHPPAILRAVGQRRHYRGTITRRDRDGNVTGSEDWDFTATDAPPQFRLTLGQPQPIGASPAMNPAVINDQQCTVGQVADKDALGLAADDPITGIVWTLLDHASGAAATEVTAEEGDTSPTSTDTTVDPSKVTFKASGQSVGTVDIGGVISTASGATFNVTGQLGVNGGDAVAGDLEFGDPQPV